MGSEFTGRLLVGVLSPYYKDLGCLAEPKAHVPTLHQVMQAST